MQRFEKDYERFSLMMTHPGRGDKWIRDNMNQDKGGPESPSRSESPPRRSVEHLIQKNAYEDLSGGIPSMQRHGWPMGSFLRDRGEEAGARQNWEKALEARSHEPAALQ